MAAEPRRSARLPPTNTVRRFFEDRRPCSIAALAKLLGVSIAEVQRKVVAGEIAAVDGVVPWDEAAHAFREEWPPHLTAELVRDIAAYPELLRASRVTWLLPAYVLVAIE